MSKFNVVWLFIIFIGFPNSSRSQWSSPVYIDSIGVSGHMVFDDAGNVYATYVRVGASGTNIFVTYSLNQGNTWSRFFFPKVEAYGGPLDIAVDRLGAVWLLWVSQDSGDFTPVYLNLSKSVD